MTQPQKLFFTTKTETGRDGSIELAVNAKVSVCRRKPVHAQSSVCLYTGFQLVPPAAVIDRACGEYVDLASGGGQTLGEPPAV